MVGVLIMETPLPVWVQEIAGAPREKTPREETPACDLDNSRSIYTAIKYAMIAEPSIEGQGGDDNAFRVACKMRDLGVSETTCLEILIDEWNPRCIPPWSFEELETKIANAYQYARGQAGAMAPDAIAGDFQVYADEGPKKTRIHRMSDLDFSKIPRREWILGRRYLKGVITLTVAPGGQGKSAFTLAEAAAIASGRPLTGEPVHIKGRVWIYNTEDSQEELDRRIAALAIHYQLTKDDLANIITTSGVDYPLTLVKDSKGGPLFNNVLIQEIIETIKSENVVLFGVDPFIRAHRVNENDNNAIDKTALAFTRIATAAGCAVGVVHHTKKGAGNNPGSMDSARGASALISAARIAHTVTGMQKAEADALKISEQRSQWFFRLDDAKGNLSPPGANTRWFEKISVPIGNGDNVVAIKAADITQEGLMGDEDRELVAAVFRHWIEPISCYQMARELKKHAPDQKERNAKTIQDQIEKLFRGVYREKNGVTLTAKLGDGKKSKAYVLGCVSEAKEAEGSREINSSAYAD